MPTTRKELLKRRVRQADRALARAMRYMSDVRASIKTSHPEMGLAIVMLMAAVDGLRVAWLYFFRYGWGGSERGLWNDDDFGIIVEQGREVRPPRNQDHQDCKG